MDKLVQLALFHRFTIVIGFLILLLAYETLKSFARFLRSSFRRIRRVPGWMMERPGGHLAVMLIAASVGALLSVIFLFALRLDSLYQPIGGASKVASLSCRASHITFHPLGSYPGADRRISIATRQWAVRGDFLIFHPYLAAAGLRSSHRVVEVIGRDQPSISEDGQTQARLGAPDPFFDLLLRYASYVPLVEARVSTSPFLGAGDSAVTLYVFEGGYSFLSPARPPTKTSGGGAEARRAGELIVHQKPAGGRG